MRKSRSLLLAALLLLCSSFVHAQNYDDPVVYMKAVNNSMADFNKTYWAYISASWHSNRAGKIARLRDQLVDNITACRYKIIDLPYYKHDNGLRQSCIDYLWLVNKVFNDDYKHLVNMEDLIDQSYGQMELYLLLEEKINDTLQAANNRMDQAEKDFAVKYSLTLTDNKSEVANKMDVANKVGKYHDKVYLLFFKCLWQESQFMAAIDKKNTTKVEQARSALLKYAVDGEPGLDTLLSWDSDTTLAGACRQTLRFYQKEANIEMPKISDFVLKEENFEKIKTSYDAKPKNSLTQQDKDAYNKALDDVNSSYTIAGQTFKDIIAARNKIVVNWNNAEQKFTDAHVPHY